MDYDETPRRKAQIKEVNGDTICGDCREPVSPNASTCPHCEARLTQGDSGLAFFFVIGGLLGATALNLVRMAIFGDGDAGTLIKAVVIGAIAYAFLRPVIRDINENA